MSRDPLIKFIWGTFCRKVITDRETNDTSIIDILPGLKTSTPLALPTPLNSQITEDSGDVPQSLGINFGKVTVIAVFGRQLDEFPDSDLELIEQDMKTEVLLPELDTQILNTPITIDAGNTATYSILVLDGIVIPVPHEKGSYHRSLEVVYRVEDVELGKVKLPITINVVHVEKAS